MKDVVSQEGVLHMSKRSLWGLLILGLLLSIWCLVELNQLRNEKSRQVEVLELQFETRRLALTDTDWGERYRGASELLEEVQSSFWHASTEGIASASIRGELEGIIRELDLRTARMELGEPRLVPGVENLRLLEVQLSARDNGGQFANAILEMEEASGELILDYIQYSSDRRQFTVHLVAPIVLQGGGGDG